MCEFVHLTSLKINLSQVRTLVLNLIADEYYVRLIHECIVCPIEHSIITLRLI